MATPLGLVLVLVFVLGPLVPPHLEPVAYFSQDLDLHVPQVRRKKENSSKNIMHAVTLIAYPRGISSPGRSTAARTCFVSNDRGQQASHSGVFYLLGGDEIPDNLRVSDGLCPDVVEFGDAPVEIPLGRRFVVAVVVIVQLVPASPCGRGGGCGGACLAASSPVRKGTIGRKPT